MEFLGAPLFVILDEVGEYLNPKTDKPKHTKEVAEVLFGPTLSRISKHSTSTPGSGLFISLSGSKYLMSYIVKNHLQAYIFALADLSANECWGLWVLWKENLKEPYCEEVADAELCKTLPLET